MQEVLLYARAYGRLPSDLVGSLTGLTEGAHFPVAADARYADDISARAALRSSSTASRSLRQRRRSDLLLADTARDQHLRRQGAPVVAVNDGVIRKLGNSQELGKFVVLEDTYGNRYTYAELGKIVRDHRYGGDADRQGEAAAGRKPGPAAAPAGAARGDAGQGRERGGESRGLGRRRDRPRRQPQRPAGRHAQGRVEGDRRDRPGPGRGSPAKASTPTSTSRSGPAGRGAPRIDPKPILDGWKLLEATAIYRAKGKNPFNSRLSGAGVLLLSKEALQQRVLADKGLSIYPCGREDIADRPGSTAASWRCSSTCARRASR